MRFRTKLIVTFLIVILLPLLLSAIAFVAVGAMVVNTVVKMWKSSVKNQMAMVLAIIAFLASMFLPISPIAIVLLGAVCGLVFPSLGKEGKA